MPLETVTITVSGANPATKTVQVNVDSTTGSGTATVPFAGTNGGQDTYVATATISGTTYTSNSAFVGWQATNGVISLMTGLQVEGYDNGGSHTSSAPTTKFGSYSAGGGNTSLVVNQPAASPGYSLPISGILTDNGDTGQYRHKPPMYDDVKSDGTALTSSGTNLGWGQLSGNAVPNASSGQFVTFFNGNLVVSTPGTHTLYFLVDDSWACYIGGGASRVQGTLVASGAPTTASAASNGTDLANVGAWPLMGCRNNAANPVQTTDYIYVNFPAAGVYPFLAWWSNGADAQCYFQTTFSQGQGSIPSSPGNFGGVVKPVAPQPTPPTTSPSGNVSLSVQSPALLIQGATTTLTINVSGITYPTKQYLPLLEGVPGQLNVANSGSNFVQQQYNSVTPDRNRAAANIFTLSGDNTAWQGKLATSWDGSSPWFNLTYVGSGAANNFVPHVDTTQFKLVADDTAWYNNGTGTFDLYTPPPIGSPGGIAWTMEIDYMVTPVVDGLPAVSPTSVPADGATHQFSVVLVKPFSLQQQGTLYSNGNSITATAWALGGAVAGTPVAQFDAAGWLTGSDRPHHSPAVHRERRVHAEHARLRRADLPQRHQLLREPVLRLHQRGGRDRQHRRVAVRGPGAL